MEKKPHGQRGPDKQKRKPGSGGQLKYGEATVMLPPVRVPKSKKAEIAAKFKAILKQYEAPK